MLLTAAVDLSSGRRSALLTKPRQGSTWLRIRIRVLYVYLFIYLCTSTCTYPHLYIDIYIYIYICMCVYIYISIYISSLSLSTYLSRPSWRQPSGAPGKQPGNPTSPSFKARRTTKDSSKGDYWVAVKELEVNYHNIDV